MYFLDFSNTQDQTWRMISLSLQSAVVIHTQRFNYTNSNCVSIVLTQTNTQTKWMLWSHISILLISDLCLVLDLGFLCFYFNLGSTAFPINNIHPLMISFKYHSALWLASNSTCLTTQCRHIKSTKENINQGYWFKQVRHFSAKM